MTDQPERDDQSRRNLAGELHAQMRATRAEFERRFEDSKQQFDRVNERIQARTGRNLIGAISVGVLLGAVLLASLLLNKVLFILFAMVLLGVSSFELSTALRHMGRRVPRTPSVITTLAAVLVAYYLGMVWVIATLLIGVGFTMLWRWVEVQRGTHAADDDNLRKDLLAAGFVQLYVSLLGSFCVSLVSMPSGQWWALAFLITVVSVDVGAYVSGLNFGKHPMAPKISPKKTWEGFAGAGVFAVTAGILLSVFMLGQPWWFGIIFGVILLITATLGDLGESHIKRTIGIKDMSSWLAGHGGFLDRLDSILPSSVVAYLLYVIVTL